MLIGFNLVGVGENIVRGLFAAFDTAIYWLIEIFFRVIMSLANHEVFSTEVIKEFRERVYIVLGLVMIFKIMISFVKIFIDPSKMNDKEQGVGNVLKRTVICLALIVLVPEIFRTARTLQSRIVPVIPRVILGTSIQIDEYEEGTEDDEFATIGRKMAYTIFRSFVNKNYFNDSSKDDNCNGAPSNGGIRITDWTLSMHRRNKRGQGDGDVCIDYKYPLSTIVGAYTLIMLVQIAIAVAIRAFKLGVCEIIAPIPIASYIDPTASKKTFESWVSITWKVYLDLFIRLIVIFFVAYLFEIVARDFGHMLLPENSTYDISSWIVKAVVFIFLVLGLLQFAKQAPKFLMDLLGIKEGDTDIAGMFKGEGLKQIRDSAKAVTNPLAVAGSNAYNTYKHQRQADESRRGAALKAALSAVGGGTSSAFRTGRGILSGQDVGEAARAGREGAINARRNRTMDKLAGVRARTRWGTQLQDYFGVDSDVTFGEDEIKAADEVVGQINNVKSTEAKLIRTKYGHNILIYDEAKKKWDDFVKSNTGIADTINTDPTSTNAVRAAFGRLNYGTGTYNDIVQVREWAEKNGHSHISSLLQDGTGYMRDIEKELFKQIDNNSLRQVDSKSSTGYKDHENLNRKAKKLDDELGDAYGTLQQTFNNNAAVLNLNPDDFDAELKTMYDSNGLDEKVKNKRAEARAKIGQDKQREAAARAAIARRKQNKNNNGS